MNRRATGITPIVCAPWCTEGDGHIGAISRGDQVCWGTEHPVVLSAENVAAEPSGQNIDAPDYHWTIDHPKLTPSAHRGFNEHPLVYLHIWLPASDLDTSVRLTPAEARQLAAEFLAVADEIDPLQPAPR